MTLQEQFFRASGIDLSDKEVSGKTPYLKDGKWSSVERGFAWQMYAKWLETQIPICEQAAWDARGELHPTKFAERKYKSIEEWKGDSNG